MTKHPCAPNCPKRSAECHAHCPDWAVYEKVHAEEKRALRQIEVGKRDADNFIIEGIRKNYKGWRGKRK